MDSSLPRPAPPRSLVERLREWVVWFGPARLAATALAVIAVGIGGTWLLKGSPSRAEDQLPFATHSAVSTTAPAGVTALGTTTTAAPTVVVYVAGAVAAPGVYTLAPLSRVTDAMSAAGGALATADLNVVNLAAAVHDGERIYVPVVGEVVPAVVAGDAVPPVQPFRQAPSMSTPQQQTNSTCCPALVPQPPQQSLPTANSTVRFRPSINSVMCTASARPNSKRCAGW